MSRQLSSIATEARRQINILIAEDEDALRLAVAKMLRKEGFFIIEASDGAVALELLRAQKQRVDVLLLDISLPKASSRDVFAEARKLDPGIAVIVTTTLSKEAATAFLGAEIERFIRKPYRVAALFDLLRTLRLECGWWRSPPHAP